MSAFAEVIRRVYLKNMNRSKRQIKQRFSIGVVELPMNTAETKQKFLLAAKIGIVKQLYKDHLITTNQYQFLLIKYIAHAD